MGGETDSEDVTDLGHDASGHALLGRFVARRQQLLGFLRLWLPQDLVEDAFQECYMIVLRRIEDFDRSRDFDAWVRGIARKVAPKICKRHRRERPVLPEELQERIEQALQEQDLRCDEDLHHLQTCLEGAQPRHQELIGLRYHQGLSLDAIAERLHATAGAIQVSLSRIRAALRNCIERRREQVQ
ncbi:MAG: sigma-70 family RNA polymerase sigma factor [Planctomycetota bacterium]|jgi:RNA polymerase sigma-70 factor (ECF subfamily)|nr:sigma-70 family RNA polymerase sigma factor [Planctomycetota bacterium]